MKQRNFILTEKNKPVVFGYMQEIPYDGSLMITIKNASGMRSMAQNRLMHFWYEYIANIRRDMTAKDVKCEAKLNIGVPIMMEDDEFREAWQPIAMAIPYESQLNIMKRFYVTSKMSVKQGTEYLNDMVEEYAADGIYLPTSDDLYYEAMGMTKK